jgi:hypothetical protein
MRKKLLSICRDQGSLSFGLTLDSFKERKGEIFSSLVKVKEIV